MTFVQRSFKVMSTVAASIAPKLLELETSSLVCGFLWGMPSGRTNIIFPKSGRGLASRSVQWGTRRLIGKRCFRCVHRCRPADFKGRVKVNGRNSVRDN